MWTRRSRGCGNQPGRGRERARGSMVKVPAALVPTTPPSETVNWFMSATQPRLFQHVFGDWFAIDDSRDELEGPGKTFVIFSEEVRHK